MEFEPEQHDPAPAPGQRRIRGFRRSYKACNLCRRKKIRCVVDPGGGGSCLRCRREGKPCVFPSERSDHAHSMSASAASGAASDDNHSHIQVPDHPGPWVSVEEEETFVAASGTDGSITTHGGGATSTGDDLASSVMRTLVSNGNDALRLLFQAATEHGDAGSMGMAPPTQPPGHAQTIASEASQQRPVPPPSSVLQLWAAFRFVKMGWFTAEEAVQYMDLFFRNLAPLSLVSRGMDASHDGHFRLITQEPLLCCIILLISTRYHTLPQAGGIVRSTLIHQRLWEHCQHLIMRIIVGQEKRSKARTRTRGSVEALLLLVEWHPRAIYFPPVSDGWDSTLLHSAFDPRDDEFGNREDINDDLSPAWHRDVVRPARTSDRMAWMLLGCAQSLALELGIYDATTRADTTAVQQPGLAAKNARVREMLYILMEQHSFRLGCPSMTPEALARMVSDRPPGGSGDDSAAAAAWLDLTNLLRSMHDVLFPSAAGVRELLRTGRYINIIRHFQQQLIRWKDTYLESAAISPHSIEELGIEYNHARAFMNSLGIQAVVDRVVGSNPGGSADKATLSSAVRSAEHDFIKEVVDGSVEVLKSANRLFIGGALRFCPVRIYLRIIAASIFLLKALSLGTNAADLKTSLSYLESCIACLRASSLDEVDLASRYGVLLDLFLTKFQESMVPASVPHSLPTFLGTGASVDGMELDAQCGIGVTDEPSEMQEGWLALPLSQSLAPFSFWNDAPEMLDPEEHLWDAIWNLPSV